MYRISQKYRISKPIMKYSNYLIESIIVILTNMHVSCFDLCTTSIIVYHIDYFISIMIKKVNLIHPTKSSSLGYLNTESECVKPYWTVMI